ncbi:MAG: AI-2E family transporter [Patescibacteria group bacterium]
MPKTKPKSQPQVIEISTWTIVKFFLVILGLVFLYAIRNIVLMLFIVTIFVAALTPTIEYLQRHKIPRLAAVTLICVIIFIIFALIGGVILPPMIEQFGQLVTELPGKLQNYLTANDTENKIKLFHDWLVEKDLVDGFTRALELIYQQISNLSATIINQTFGVISGAIGIFTIIALTFYLLLEEEGIRSFLLAVLPVKSQISAFKIWQKASVKTGNWLRGQLLISFTIGLLTYIGFSILGVKYPLVLAVIAGIANIVPYIGPIAGAIPAVLIALVQSPWLALGVIIVALLIQQIDSQFITPRIMGKFVGLSPVTIIVALLIGGTLAGVWGVILAIPISATIGVIIEEWDVG